MQRRLISNLLRQRLRIMRRKHAIGERDIGEVFAYRVDCRIKRR